MAPKVANPTPSSEFQKRNLIAKNIADKLEASLKPLGTFNIPTLLDKRRLEYGIPNGAFKIYPTWDRVYLYQIPMEGRETYAEGGMIIQPEDALAYKKNTSARGILVACGLAAMDKIYATGYKIGHIVRFKKFSPFIVPVDNIDGHELQMMIVRDGDLEGSEDMAEEVYMSGRGKFVNVAEKDDRYDFRYELDGKITGTKQDEYYDPSI
jgi:hypothetical protein